MGVKKKLISVFSKRLLICVSSFDLIIFIFSYLLLRETAPYSINIFAKVSSLIVFSLVPLLFYLISASLFFGLRKICLHDCCAWQ